MIFFILLLLFFQLKNETYFKENLNSKDKTKFVMAVKEIRKMNPIYLLLI